MAQTPACIGDPASISDLACIRSFTVYGQFPYVTRLNVNNLLHRIKNKSKTRQRNKLLKRNKQQCHQDYNTAMLTTLSQFNQQINTRYCGKDSIHSLGLTGSIITHVYYYTPHTFNGLFSRTIWVNQYQKGRNILDFNEAREDKTGWQWHQLDHVQIICTSFQTDNHTSNSSFKFFTGQMLFLTRSQQCQMDRN